MHALRVFDSANVAQALLPVMLNKSTEGPLVMREQPRLTVETRGRHEAG